MDYIDNFKTLLWPAVINDIEDVKVEHRNLLKAYFHLLKWGPDPKFIERFEYVAENSRSDGFSCFILSLTWLHLGDADKCMAASNKIVGKNSIWQKAWVYIEFLGGTGGKDKLIDYLTRLLAASSKEDLGWITSACVRGLSYGKVDIHSVVNVYDSFGYCFEYENNYFIKVLKFEEYHKKEDSIDGLLNYEKSMVDYWGYDARIVKNILNILSSVDRYKDELTPFVLNVNKVVPANIKWKGILATYLAIGMWNNGKIDSAIELLQKSLGFRSVKSDELTRYSLAFFDYILLLCASLKNNGDMYKNRLGIEARPLYVFGESHSMSPANVLFKLNDNYYKGVTSITLGLKAFHIGKADNIHYKMFCDNVKNIPKGEDALITVGEIDCRIEEGIYPASIKKNIPYAQLVDETVEAFFDSLVPLLKDMMNIYVQGVPAPTESRVMGINENEYDVNEYLDMVAYYNLTVKNRCRENGWYFIDVYSATVGEKMFSNGKWHIDNTHINPAFYSCAGKYLI